MTDPASIGCDRDLLRRSLDERLSSGQEEALTSHLSGCASCQQALEELAAHRPRWQQIRQVLRDESSSAQHHPLDGKIAALPDETGEYDARRTYAGSEVDFAVNFLDASNHADALGRIAEIDILEVIGQGGMGIVLKGFQPSLNRPVAVKVLAPHLASSGAARQRFARESQAAAAIVHPNVMPIHTVDASGKLPYLVMPYINGESLQQRIDRQGALDLVDVLRIGLQVARGLAAAHAQGLVHRDVKPANILLECGVDRVVLTDFGLARAADDASLTRTGFIAGTPQYMSPEQARGEAIDARSDLFSLGSVMYTMSSGRAPFRAESSYGILRRITDDEPRLLRESQPHLPAWLDQLIRRLLAKNPAERFATADEVADLIEQCLAHLQQPPHVPLPAQLAPPSRGTKVRPGWAVPCVVLLALTIASLFWQRHSSGPNTHPVGPREPAYVTPQVAPSATDQALSAANESDQRAGESADTGGWEDAIDMEMKRLKFRVNDLQRQVDLLWQ